MLLPQSTSNIPGFQSVGITKDVAFGGVIDRLYQDSDGPHVIDYKTGKYDELNEWQLPLYAVLVSRLLQKLVARTSYMFLDEGRRYTQEIIINKNVETINKILEN